MTTDVGPGADAGVPDGGGSTSAAGAGAGAGADPRLTAAREYVLRGWRVFVLNADKTPLPNCPACPAHNAVEELTGQRHDAEQCGCLTCHGFYAATGDLVRLELVLERHPRGLLAVRTGLASGIVVIDAEVTSDHVGELTGIEVLDAWETLVSGTDVEPGWELPRTLRQRTKSGGVHLVYRLPAGVELRSRNRVLPNVDIKADGGYVAVPPGAGRAWLDDLDAVAPASPELVRWLASTRGRGGRRASGPTQGVGGTRASGYDFNTFVREGCPVGCRDEFVNEFYFKLRKTGLPRTFADDALGRSPGWLNMAQPIGDEYTWADCLRKGDHVYASVGTDEEDEANRRSQGSRGQTGEYWRDDDATASDTRPAGDGSDPRVAPAHLGGADDVYDQIGTSPANPHRNTDLASGVELARFMRGRVMSVPELGWSVYDGRRCVNDVAETHVKIIIEYVNATRRIVTTGVAPEQEQEITMNRVTRLESAAGMRAALTWAKPLLTRSITEFDTDPWLFNCPNGTLDLRTGVLRAHDPVDLLTRLCPTEYAPDATDEVWERVLATALPDPRVRSWVQRFAGYCLTGITSEKTFLVATGQTNTGKSTVTEALARTLGDVSAGGYATVWDSEVIQDGTQVNRAEKLSKARPARLVVVGELMKGSRMSDTFVKSYTGGETMDARALYRESFSYVPQGKLWMATNYVPSSPDRALQGRLGLVPFTQVVRQRDPGVKRWLDEDQGAHQAILAWAVRGCLDWVREGTLGERPWLASLLEEYANDSDSILGFINDECVRVDVTREGALGHSVPGHELWQRYSLSWAPENTRRPLLKRKFEAALREHGFAKVRTREAGSRQFVWGGLRLRIGDDE